MSRENVLITGGAGFIGSHLADALVALGHDVTVVDSLDTRVHGRRREPPPYLNASVRFVKNDLSRGASLDSLVEDKSVIFHLASLTSVSESMTEIEKYAAGDIQSLATLLERIGHANRGRRKPWSDLKKLIVASSRAVYGEGQNLCGTCGPVWPLARTVGQLRRGEFDVMCPNCGAPVTPLPTPESALPQPASVYGASKLAQEHFCTAVARAHGFAAVVLRFFNVYGPRQAVDNPLTGIVPFFARKLLNGSSPPVFEDGKVTRDFIHVSDVVRACVLAMEKREADDSVFNVGTGRSLSLLDAATMMATMVGGKPPTITRQYRVGDIRHCDADITAIRNALGFAPRIAFEEGIRAYLAEAFDPLGEFMMAARPLPDHAGASDAR